MAATRGQNKENILQFHTFVSAMPHFLASTRIQLSRHVQGSHSFGRPAVHFDEKHVALASTKTDAAHTLLCLDSSLVREGGMTNNPVTAQIALPQAIQDIHWIGGSTLLACVGEKEGPSNLRVYNINFDGTHEFELKDSSMTADTVREVAVDSTETNRVIYGGYDQKVSFADFKQGPQPISRFKAGGDVSSVRWSPYHNSRLISCTNNDGQLRIFDVNGGEDPAWMYQTDVRAHLNLYSHCQISEYQVLLSYEDSYIEAIDIRKAQSSLSNFMTGTTDPYCYMVGDLHYRESSGLLLATGMADFSVYKHFRDGPGKHTCKLWCHSEASTNRAQNDTDAVCHGVFLNDTWAATILEGNFCLYKID